MTPEWLLFVLGTIVISCFHQLLGGDIFYHKVAKPKPHGRRLNQARNKQMPGPVVQNRNRHQGDNYRNKKGADPDRR